MTWEVVEVVVEEEEGEAEEAAEEADGAAAVVFTAMKVPLIKLSVRSHFTVYRI